MLWDMSLRASILILCVLLLRKVPSVPKRLFVVFWDIVIIRLWVPGLVEIPVDVGQMIPVSGQEAAVSVIAWNTIWAAGFLGTALIMLCLYVREYRMLRECLPLDDLERRRVEACIGEKHPGIYTTDRIATPVAFGIREPKIVLPKSFVQWDDAQLAYALQHELVHLRFHDNLQKIVVAATVCMHWFNPLVWIMRYMLDRDLERACDEKVISLCGEPSRYAYIRALLEMASPEPQTSVYVNGFGKSAIYERINSMMKHKKTTIFAGIVAAGALALSATAFAAPVPKDESVEATPFVSVATSSEDTDGALAVYSTESTRVDDVSYEVDVETGTVKQDGKVIGSIDAEKGTLEMPEDGVVISVHPDAEGVYEITATDENA